MTGSDLPPLRIATRASQLALWQAEHVADLLRRTHPGLQVELVTLSTQGDRNRTDPLPSFGGLGVFTREIQQALLDDRADVAVHSLKDLPTQPVEQLLLAGIPQRGPRFDALILPEHAEPGELATLPARARIGTGSPRRQAQLRFLRSDLQPMELRGNVETRLSKLDQGECDALILAQAGLERLNFSARCTAVLAPPQMFPAVGQGALGLECRADDQVTRSLLEGISHRPTVAEVFAERACLGSLRAGCHAPVGVWSLVRIIEESRFALSLLGVVLSVDGESRVQACVDGQISCTSWERMTREAEAVGNSLAEALLAAGATALLEN